MRTADLLGDLEDERIAAADDARRRGDDLSGQHGRFELLALGLVDPVREGRVDHDGQRLVGVLLHDRSNGFVELSQTRERSSLGCNVRSVHH